ncbi:MAG: hypothetical protein COV52_01490 [Gammaproteobacteria bacterium CG11_big_fil_rev_8_21_14_0_20_46_22]|nr:MAG: hypothetical protein COW05_03215 [Gammaproteobacteria bacterium CG12_big_fil_rev_8_21_14_0_65_46_12]PIR11928.1 MAG: hypothetical protein COV52_01490 [Gammaproteobacteria bacterium CG11_big_fil_rev_8_21_14_0_20_46_22]
MKRSRATVYIAWLMTLILVFFIVSLAYIRLSTRSPIIIHGLPHEDIIVPHKAPTLPNNQKVVRILIIDGGGIHGIIPAYILNYLSEKTGKPISQLFDIMAGTSSGSISVTALNTPDKNGKPKLSTQDLIGIYNHIGPQLLKNPWYHQVLTLGGLIGPMLPASNLDHAYEKYLGQTTRFDELIKPVLVPVYSFQERRVLWFKSWELGKSGRPDFYTHEVVSAATATPGVFPPVIIQSMESRQSYLAGDAFNAVNDPGPPALFAAMKLYPNKRYLVVSLGTGEDSTNIPGNQAIHWGLAQWMRYILIDFMKGQVDTTVNIMQNLQEIIPKRFVAYYRFNAPIPPQLDDPFNVSPKNIKALNHVAQAIVNSRRAALDKVACELSPQSCPVAIK